MHKHKKKRYFFVKKAKIRFYVLETTATHTIFGQNTETAYGKQQGQEPWQMPALRKGDTPGGT